MVRGEGNVVGGMPVFGCDAEREGEGEEAVYGRDYGAAVGDGEGAVLEDGVVSVVVFNKGAGWRQGGERGGELTGGQKSSWTSTTIRAGLKVAAMISGGD